MTKGNLRLVSPRAVIGTLPPRRKPNAELRTREYLTEAEVERLIKAAKANRHGQRDATMIVLAFRQWAAGGGISGLALGSSGPGAQCMFACAPGQEWNAECASIAGR